MEELKRLRKARGLSQAKLAALADLDPSTVSQIETGARRANSRTLERLATALGVEVRDLFPLGQAPLPDFEEGRPTSKPLSPNLRRRAADMRRAELESVLKHVTVRTETLRAEAKQRHQATDKQGLWALFLDSILLVEGAVSLLASNREEAQEFGGEIGEERRLRGRLEHHTEDLDAVTETIGDMWAEVSHAEADAEHEAEHEAERDNVVLPFRRKRAG